MFDRLRFQNGSFLALPALQERIVARAQGIDLLSNSRGFFGRLILVVLFQCTDSDFFVDNRLVHGLKLGGLGGKLHADIGRGLVNEIDGLIGKVFLGDVAG